MHIELDEIVIRKATIKDTKILYTWWTDGQIMAHAGFPLGLQITENEILDQLTNESDESGRRHIIEYDENPIGEMLYRFKNCNLVEIGIKICDKSKQNRGFGTIILREFIKRLFIEFSINKIILSTNKENSRARYVYERLGFDLVFLEEDAWTNQIGEKVSVANYELDKSKYNTYKDSICQ